MAQIRSGEIRASDAIIFLLDLETSRQSVSANVTVVLRSFADGESHRLAGRNRRPRNSGWIYLLRNFPARRVDLIDATKVTRSHPQLPVMPRQRLRRWRG